MIFCFGRKGEAHVKFTNFRWEFPELEDYWDGNWLLVDLEIHAHPFSGRLVNAFLRAEEMRSLLDDLIVADRDLAHKFGFQPMEPWLTFNVAGDGKGHFRAECKTGMAGATLTFRVLFDQTDLGSMIRALKPVVEAFPIRGTPPNSSSLG